MKFVTKKASKLLGNCRPENIVKELKKLKQQDTSTLEAANAVLLSKVAEMRVEMAKKDVEFASYEYKRKAWSGFGKSWRIRPMS